MQRDILYKPSEVAKMLDCDVSTVRRYLRDDVISGLVTHTGRYKIPESSISKFLADCTTRFEQLILFDE